MKLFHLACCFFVVNGCEWQRHGLRGSTWRLVLCRVVGLAAKAVSAGIQHCRIVLKIVLSHLDSSSSFGCLLILNFARFIWTLIAAIFAYVVSIHHSASWSYTAYGLAFAPHQKRYSDDALQVV